MFNFKQSVYQKNYRLKNAMLATVIKDRFYVDNVFNYQFVNKHEIYILV